MDHAIAQYLERIGDDCAAVLGPGMTVLGVERAELDGIVRLQVRYQVRGDVHETVGAGDTVIAAHAALRRQLIDDRLAIGFTELVNAR
jgi:hypothetical protein